MKTSDFLNVLEQHPGKALYFEYQTGAFARTDYHITEIKNVTFDTVDCGGLQNAWQETHVQLWENPNPEPQHQVDTGKALKIFQTVEKARPALKEAVIKFEYGNAGFHTAVLPVGSVSTDEDKVIIRLVPEQTTCKAKDRLGAPEAQASACCGDPLKNQGTRIPVIQDETAGSACC